MILKVLSLLLGFVTLWGFACFNKRTWGSSTCREGLFPVREICIHGSSNQNKKRALSPSGSAFHMTRQCLDAPGIFPHWSSSQRGDACEHRERWQRAWSWCWGLLLCAPASTLCPPGTAVVDSTPLGYSTSCDTSSLFFFFIPGSFLTDRGISNSCFVSISHSELTVEMSCLHTNTWDCLERFFFFPPSELFSFRCFHFCVISD